MEYMAITDTYSGLKKILKILKSRVAFHGFVNSPDNKLIHIGKPIEFDERKFFIQLNELKEAVENEQMDVRERLMEIVPTYTPMVKE